MSSPNRRLLNLPRRAALVAVLALAACNMTPAYGPQGSGTALHGKVALRAPDDVDSFVMNQRLAERLGDEEVAKWKLDYRLTIAAVAQGITPDEVTTRYSLNGTADFALTDINTGAVIVRGRVSNFTSYSAIGTTISTLTSETDAHKRLMIMLADQIVTRLLATGPKPAQ